ncbi:MAG: PQQ-binding-like beta-propeller repeat protein, partial [Bryobacteraceae bacterium]
VDTGNEPRALHSMMPPVIADNVKTDSGPKQIAILAGVSDNLYAIDVEKGEIIWKKHFTYPPVKNAHSYFDESKVAPSHLGFLNPGGSSDVPVIGPPDAKGRRPVYFVDGGGTMHTLSVADGEDLKPPFKFATGKGWALNLVGDTIWMPHGSKISAVKLDDPAHVMTATDGSGGMWGLRGVSVDSTGTAWTTTGDGEYDPAKMMLANGIVGFHIVNNQVKVKNWYVPIDWRWIRKRDLDPNNTPAIFKYKGRELMVASGKECRLFLMDPSSPGGADHQTPLYRSPLFCNEEVDFQNAGSWGGITTWKDADGTRWILAPFWGPADPHMKFPITNTPVTENGGLAAFKLEENNGKWQLTPAWVSRDMDRAYPPVVANGVVYVFGSGESTQQAWPIIGLDFD